MMERGRLPTTDLKRKALELGFQAAGVCEASPPPHLSEYKQWLEKGYQGTMRYLERHLPLKAHPDRLLPGCQSVIAVSLNYNQPNQSAPGYPRIAKYALGRDYHRVIRSKLLCLAKWVESSCPGAKCRACVDSAPIMERDYAWLAGLGFFGKNTMLIDPRRGSWFFIGLLLTTVSFESDPPSTGRCGSCTRCIDACPTGAILNENGRWQIDSRKCVSYLTIEHKAQIDPSLHSAIGDWTFGCDICQEVCPFNEPRSSQPMRAAVTTDADLTRTRQLPPLQRIAEMKSEEWDLVTRGSALRRAGYEGLRRNALINLKQASATHHVSENAR